MGLHEDSRMLYDTECEKLVLGTILSKAGELEEVREILTADCFYNSRHRDIYKAILSVCDRSEEVSMISVLPELQKSGTEISPIELSEISGHISVDSLYQYAARLYDLSRRRMFWKIGQYLIKAGTEESEDIADVLSHAKNKLDSVFEDSTVEIYKVRDTIRQLYEQINKNSSNNHGITGDKTGFYQLDDKGGLQGSDLIIIAGETSQGKTSLATSIALHASVSGGRVAFYSLEMTKLQLTARLAAMESGVPSTQILYRKLASDQITDVDRGVSKFMNAELYFDDRSNSNIDAIISSIRSMRRKYNITGAVIDYIQILNVNMKGANKEQQMGDVSRRLKNLAKDLGIWIIALSQLSRDRANPIPTIHRLRDSGQIAEAADSVILVYRPELNETTKKIYPEPFSDIDPKGTAMIDVCKGRNTGIIKFIVGFDSQTTKFYPLSEMPMLADGKEDNMPW